MNPRPHRQTLFFSLLFVVLTAVGCSGGCNGNPKDGGDAPATGLDACIACNQDSGGPICTPSRCYCNPQTGACCCQVAK